MYLVLLLAAGAILGGVVVVAMGRGGEMALFRRDIPVALRPHTPAEVAMQRLPIGPLGYQVQATEDALLVAASLLAEREAEIAALRGEIWRLRSGSDGGTTEITGDPQADGVDQAL